MSHAVRSMSLVDGPATLWVAAAAVVYARGWFRIRRNHSLTISVRRLGFFMAGLLSLWTAIGSPLTVFQHELLSVHMVQHVLLMAVAPPLMLLGSPARPFLYGLPRSFQQVAGSRCAQSLRT